MKRFLLSFGLLASLTMLLGADFNSVKIPAVTVTVSDFTLDYSPASRSVILQPDAGGTALSGTSDADGVVGFPRVTPGLYTLTISGVGLSPLTLRVPNQSGTLSASNLVISNWTPPSGAPYAAATDNLRAWSLLGTTTGAKIWSTNEVGQPIISSDFPDDVLLESTSFSQVALGSPAGYVSVFTDTTGPLLEIFVRYTPLPSATGEDYTLLDPVQNFGSFPYLFAAKSDIDSSHAHTVWRDSTNTATLATLWGDGSLGLAGSIMGTNGVSSLDTTAAVTIAATGWTNTFTKNAVVYYDGTNITAKVYNNAGTAVYTNAVPLGGGSILLQPSGKVILSGTSVSGRATPF